MKQYDIVRLVLTSSLSDREIAASVGVSKTTVARYRRLAQAKQLTWPEVSPLSPEALDRLFNQPANGGRPPRAIDLALLHERLQGQGMTLQWLWEELRRDDPYTTPSYSQLAALLRRHRETLPTVMRQRHIPGQRAFVDYSGTRPYYIDAKTGQKVHVELFVGVLGCSSLMFAMCTHSQKVPDFIRAHVCMLDYFGGLPEVIVPDNLRSAVVKTGREPTLQRSYADFARHYGLAILPARPYRPRDKGSVEVSVQLAQQRILVPLQHQRFYSLEDLNVAIARQLDELNARPMSKDHKSRRERFEALERSALRPLPEHPYIYAEWIPIPKVPADYHVCVEGHFYSVPHHLIGKSLDARLTDQTVELMHQRKCVARHTRSGVVGGHTTTPSHQPEAHRAYAERTVEGMLAWAKESGTHLLTFVRAQFDQPQPFRGLPACDTLRSLARKHGTAVLDEAARDVLAMRSPTISALKRALENRRAQAKQKPAPRSTNARGARYFTEAPRC